MKKKGREFDQAECFQGKPMAIILDSLADIPAHRFDDIIDLRSPSEYADDHLPGAVNLPVLDDAERAHVGTIYKQVAPFAARKIGAALVARNAARHIEGPLIDKPGDWRPLVYCWRGGQRSGSFATILSQIGWRVETIAGGYKSWRKLVSHELVQTPIRAPVLVLDGNTGTAKTEILQRLAGIGGQVIDLEGLANHRGSLFGARGGQPTQKLFEGRLACALAALDPSRPLLVEAESACIGKLRLPPQLWRAMRTAPRIEIIAPREQRAAYLARAYRDLCGDRERLGASIERLRPYHPAALIGHWQHLASLGRFEALAHGLTEAHYDPRYARHRSRFPCRRIALRLESLDPKNLDSATMRLAELIAAGI